jgi:hypothetical protein
VHLAYGAQDAPALDHAALASLASLDPARQGEIRFACAPGSALVASLYPIARIWRIHQDGFDGEFGVDWKIAETSLVTRDACRVVVRAASDAEAAFIGAVLQGATFDAACTAALGADDGADLGALLAHAVATNLICAFTIDQEEA